MYWAMLRFGFAEKSRDGKQKSSCWKTTVLFYFIYRHCAVRQLLLESEMFRTIVRESHLARRKFFSRCYIYIYIRLRKILFIYIIKHPYIYTGQIFKNVTGKSVTEGTVKVNLAFYVATSRYSVAPKRNIGHRLISYLFRTISLLQVAPVDYLQLPHDSTIDVGSVLEL